MPASFVGFVRISAGVDQSNLERFSTRASFGKRDLLQHNSCGKAVARISAWNDPECKIYFILI